MPYRQICHEHCPKGVGSRAALAVLVLIVVIAAAAGPVAHAADAMLRVAVDVLEVAGIVVAAAAVLGVAGWAASRMYARQHQAALEAQARPARQVADPRPAQALTAPRLAIEAPGPQLYVITSEHPAPVEENPCPPSAS